MAAELTADFRGHCERIAVEQRQRLQLQAFDPLSGERVAESLEIPIATPEQMPALSSEHRELFNRHVWGLLLRDIPVILIRESQSPARRQSTLMHEISHYLLDHAEDDLIQILMGAPRDKRQEAEASYLGGCLQIPRTALLWASQVGLSAAHVAERFNASQEMVRWRCNATRIRL